MGVLDHLLDELFHHSRRRRYRYDPHCDPHYDPYCDPYNDYGQAPRSNAAQSFCSGCSAPLEPGARFCAQCGVEQRSGATVPICSNCGTELPPGARFCSTCGQAVRV